MDNSEFDEYIREQTQYELDVPEGLDWEQMNIPIPDGSKTKKKRGVFWLFFLGCAVGIMFSYYYMQYPMQKGLPMDHHEAIAEVPKSPERNTASAGTQNDQGAPSQSTGVNKLAPSVDEPSKSKKFQGDMITNRASNTEAYATQAAKESMIVSTADVGVGVRKYPTSETIGDLSAQYIAERLDIPNSNDSANEGDVGISRSTDISDSEVTSEMYNDVRQQISVAELEWVDHHFLFLEQRSIAIMAPEKAPMKNKSFYIVSGLNLTENRYTQGPQAEALSDAENYVVGMNVQSGIKLPVGDNFALLLGLDYQRSNYKFSYTENLGIEYSVAESRKRTQLRNIIHYNSIDLLGLQVGLEKTFSFGRNWGWTIGGSLIPGYKIRATGRSVADDLSVYTIDRLPAHTQFLLRGQVSTGVSYQIGDFMILGRVGYQDSFTKVGFDQDSDLLFAPRALQLKLGIERKF